MHKTYAGNLLRRLRREKDLSQAAFAAQLGLSPSYVNQMEHDVRPLTVPVLLRITDTFGVDASYFAPDTEAKLLKKVTAITRDRNVCADGVSPEEVADIVANHPRLAEALIILHEKATAVSHDTGKTSTAAPAAPYEQSTDPEATVTSYWTIHRNFVASLDLAAEELARDLVITLDDHRHREEVLINRLTSHGVEVTSGSGDGDLRRKPWTRGTKTLFLPQALTSGQRAFRAAGALAHLELAKLMDQELESVGLGPDQIKALATSERHHDELLQARALLTNQLADYTACAIVLPYTDFLTQAESCRYDIEQLSQADGYSYETICRRLATLQRPGLSGVPFTYVRVDRAGNVIAQRSANGFVLPTSGTCPRWAIHGAFATPQDIIRQVTVTPDGRKTVWICRTVHQHRRSFTNPGVTYAVGLGCPADDITRTVCAEGLHLNETENICLDHLHNPGPACR